MYATLSFILLGVATLAPSVHAGACGETQTADYGNNFLIKAYPPAPTALGSWTGRVCFDRAFNNIGSYKADGSVESGNTCVALTSKWDAGVGQGQSIEQEFQIWFSGTKPQITGIEINGQVACGSLAAAAPTTTTTTAAPGSCSYDYEEALGLSLLFYEAQRAGPLPPSNRISWRQSACTQDDVTGGYFDAGDNVNFNFPMAGMTTQLAWGAISWEQGYKNAGQLDELLDALQWATDYFIACHTSANVFYAQFGNGAQDHALWSRPEDITGARVPYKIDASNPGSDLAAETAAALAAASIVYRSNGLTLKANDAYAHAETLYSFADTKRGKYSDAVPDAAEFYKSWSGYNDELGWGAAWLAKAATTTAKKNSYITKSKTFYNPATPTSFDWDNKNMGHHILLFELTGDSTYKTSLQNIATAIDAIEKTPAGMSKTKIWGPLRYTSNLAHACFQIAELSVGSTTKNLCRVYGENQINIALGSTGRSYVVGFGTNYPKQPHHRAASCPDIPQSCGWSDKDANAPNPHVLKGALVGGPDFSDNFEDKRDNFKQSEVATDYNAGFQSAVAYLCSIC